MSDTESREYSDRLNSLYNKNLPKLNALYFGNKDPRELVGDVNVVVNKGDFKGGYVSWSVTYRSNGEEVLSSSGYKGQNGLVITVWSQYFTLDKENSITYLRVLTGLLGMWGMGQSEISPHYSGIIKTLMDGTKSGEFIIEPNVKETSIHETKFKLKMDDPNPPQAPQAAPELEMPQDGGGEDFGGFDEPAEGGDDKPFDDTPFDAGVEADEENNPEKYIQQLSGKLGQSLRQYTDSRGEPDFDLEKFAINSVLSATNSSKMSQEDVSDIISKVKSSSTEDSDNLAMPQDGGGDEGGQEGGQEGGGEEGGIDLSDIDMEEGHNPNPHRKTVFQNATLDVENNGMEENKYLNLENQKKSSIFVDKKEITKNMIKTYLNESPLEPTTKPRVKPDVAPATRPSRRGKPWRVTPQEDPNPKALDEDGDKVVIQFIDSDNFTNDSVNIIFDVDGVRFSEAFNNTGEVLTKPEAYDESWVYSFESDVLSNGNKYGVAVSFFGHPNTNLDLEGFTDGEVPEIEEI